MRLLPRALLALSTSLTSLTAVAPAAHAADLWTEVPAKGRAPIAIPSIAPLVQRLEPAVLVIFTEGEMAEEDLPPGHPPLRNRGGDDDEGPQEMQGQGAGFLITKNGYALTNQHVVENARRISVVVGESRIEHPARVVGVDAKTDVALIRIDGNRTDWPVIPLGDSGTLAVGDFVVAIGSPFGLQQSVSLGIVSARGRRDIAPSGREGLYDFLQTDASINPGNSGGPLLNLYGEAIGINSAVNAAGSGIGFAIPINMVKRLLPALKERGRFDRSWIGVGIQRLSPELARALGLDRARGALVREVVADGPAAKAGIEPGDVIVSFEGQPIEDANDLPLLAGDAGVGKSVSVDVVREKAKRKIPVVLGAHPENEKAVARAEEAAASDKPEKGEKTDKGDKKSAKADAKDKGSIGITVVTLDGDARARLKLGRDQKGSRVVKVKLGSPGYIGGLQPDDVIVKVNGKGVSTAADFAAAVKDTESGDALRLGVLRGAQNIFLAIVMP